MSQQLQITGGAKVRSLEGVITGSTGVLGSLPINGSNGIPQLDSNGKILVSQLPNSVMEYLGTWNVTTNTPTLVNGTGNAGDVYLVEGAATGGTSHNFGAGPITFYNGDQVIYSGSIWQRASGSTGSVTSVAVTETGDALTITGSPITTSGTINIGFAGSSTQYVAGDGTLVTFPTIVTEAQNLITDVYNSTGATLTKGTVVYINGGHGNLPTIAKALATSDATSAQTYGVVQVDITNNNNGHVVVIGRLENLDTQAYANGTQLYLSSTTAGAWTSTKQYAPNHLVYVGIVTRSHPTQGVVEVKIQNGYELDELHNVSAQTPSNNQGIFYNSSTSLWENKSIATALGYTPLSGSGTSNFLPKYTGANTLNNSIIYDTGTYIGIGTEYPSFKLEVNGTGKFSGQLTLGSTITNGTYTYTLPSATGTLALTSDIPSVSGYVPYTGAGSNVDLGNYTLSAANLYAKAHGGFGSAGQLYLGKGSAFAGVVGYSSIAADEYNKFLFFTGGTTAGNAFFNFNSISVGADRNYTFPNADGTIALTSDIPSVTNFVTLNTLQTIIGTKIYSSLQYFDNNVYIKHSISGSSSGYTTLGASASGLNINLASGTSNNSLNFASTSASNTYTFPNATGTVALTTDLSSYVPTSRTLTINGTTYDLSADRSWTVSGSQWTTSGSNIYYNTGNVGIGSSSPSFAAGVGLVISSATRSNLSLTDGTNAFNIFQDSTSAYFNVYSSGDLIFRTTTSNTERMRLTNLGNLSIGNTNNTYKLDVTGTGRFTGTITAGAANGNIRLSGATTDGFIGVNTSTMYLTDWATATKGMVINLSTGNVGIGTSSPTDSSGFGQIIDLNGSSGAGLYARYNSSATAYFLFGQDSSGSYLYAKSTPMQFLVNNAERMRIGTQGNMGLGVVNDPDIRLYIKGQNSTSSQFALLLQNSSSNNLLYVRNDNYAFLLASSWAYGSDLRLKENISDVENGVDMVLKMKPKHFDYINGQKNNLGFIAQEVQEIIPQAVSISDKKTGILALKTDFLIPYLVKAIQELKAEIDELKNK